MNTKSFLVVLSSGLVIGLIGCGAQSQDASSEPQEHPGVQRLASEAHSKLAGATMDLEKQFSDQFIKGKIDREALAPTIKQVIQAFPESARSKVAKHIDTVLAGGEKAVKELTPDQRKEIASPPPAEKIDKTAQDWAYGWGWGPYYGGYGGYGGYYGTGWAGCGWGGYGAFAWPGYYYGYGYPYGGYGYGTGYYGYGGCGVYATGCGGWYY